MDDIDGINKFLEDIENSVISNSSKINNFKKFSDFKKENLKENKEPQSENNLFREGNKLF